MANTIAAELNVETRSPHREAMNWINGGWIDSSKRTKSFDPATGQEIGSFADASHDDVQSAIRAATEAFKTSNWKENRALRAKVLNQIADRFEARRDDLIEILSLENGKIKTEAAFEVGMIPSKFRYWAAASLMDYGGRWRFSPDIFRSSLDLLSVLLG